MNCLFLLSKSEMLTLVPCWSIINYRIYKKRGEHYEGYKGKTQLY